MSWARFNPQPDPEREKNTGDDWSRFNPTPAPTPKLSKRQPKRIPPAIELRPSGQVYDGDTYRTQGGYNARLSGADAFELRQPGRNAQGALYPLGGQSRNALARLATPEASARATGEETYGRPVVNLLSGNRDAGNDLVAQGMAIPDPRFIPANQLGNYIGAQRGAIASETGAYGGQYQFPWDYRAQGASAPWRGRVPMDPETAASWEALLRNPATKREDVLRWLADHGQKAENIDNIMSLVRQNQATRPRPVFQQQDVQGNPVAPVQPFWKRQAAAVAEGAPDVLGVPGEALEQGVAGPFGPLIKLGIDQSGISLPDNAEVVGDRVVLRWNPEKPKTPELPEEYRASVKAREGVGPMRPDEVAMFADSWEKPKTGFRFSADQEDQLDRAARAEAAGAAPPGTVVALAKSFGGNLNPASVEARVEWFRRNPGKKSETSPVDYSSTDKLATAAETPDEPALGTEDIRQAMHGVLGVGQLDESYAPQSTPERYLQAAERSVPSAIGGAAGVRAVAGNLSRQALASTAGGATGSYLGAQAADDVAPGNDLVSMVAQFAGGGLGGLGAHRAARPRVRAAEAPSVVEPAPFAPASEVLGQFARPVRPRELVETMPTGHGWDSAVIDPQGKIHVLGRDAEGAPLGHPQFGEMIDPGEAAGFASISAHAHELALRRAANETPAQARTIAELSARGRRDGRPVTEGGVSGIPEVAYPPRSMAMDAEDPSSPSITAPVEAPPKTTGGLNGVSTEAADALGSVTPEDVLPPSRIVAEAPNAPKDMRGLIDAIENNARYDDPPMMAGNIKLENLSSPQNIRQALTTVAEKAGGFDEARRGKIAHDETIALAEELGMTARQLLGRRKGEAFNAEQALGARQLLAKSGNEIVNQARALTAKIAEGTASDADLVRFRQNLAAHAAIQQEVAGMTAEAGRTLSQFRIPADSRMVRGDVLRSLVDQSGGLDGVRKIAETILDNADDPKRMNLITRALTKPGLRDKFIELYYNFLLSGPRTHAVNVTSNIMTSLLQTPEHLAAAVIGAPRGMLANGADRVLFSEVGARVTGMIQGAREGLREFGKTMKTGEPSDAMSKVESTTHRAIGGPAGSVIRTPTRLLMAEDEFFKATARRMETVGRAVRQARSEGLRGRAARERAAELAANPTPEMLEAAIAYGRYLTFQTPLGPAGQAVLNLTNRAPALKLFIPFVRTPLNILKFAIERSPAAPFLREWRADIKAGGARRDLALAKVGLGTGAAMLAVEAARNGMLTGSGPADEKARNVWLAAGNQPYSVKIGDKFYSYQRLDPLSTTLGLAADYVGLQEQMTEKQRENMAATIAQSAMQNLASKTWLSGMTDLAQALDDPGRYFENTFTRLGASIATPTLSAQMAAAVDPVMRDGQGLAERIQSRIPGMSDELPARRDVMGEPIEAGNGGGLAAFSPVFVGERVDDPLTNMLADAGIGISRAKRGDLSPKQFEQAQIRAAAIFKPELQELVSDPEWRSMDPEERQNEVDRIVARARKEAKRDILLGEPNGPAKAADPWARFKPTKAQ